MDDPAARNVAAGPRGRSNIWKRLRELGLLQEAELIRIHRIAQQEGIRPEAAALALGAVTERQLLVS